MGGIVGDIAVGLLIGSIIYELDGPLCMFRNVFTIV